MDKLNSMQEQMSNVSSKMEIHKNPKERLYVKKGNWDRIEEFL